MLIVLSPAKNLNEEPHHLTDYSLPRHLDESGQLISKLKSLSGVKLEKLMDISPALASLNKERYINYKSSHDLDNAKPAIYAFMGDVYRGLDANSLSQEGLAQARGHLRMLSGLYGVLRPFDLIQPYRLEMGTRLPVRRKKNLYEFWGNKITEQLNEDAREVKSRFIVNLASDEYWKAVNEKELEIPALKINFREWRNGRYAFLSFNAKRARGMMARYLLENQVNDVEGILGFDYEDYAYNPELSEENSLIFTRE